ncbi:alpha/beta fold hydrolase [Actinomadura sp. 9N407]|uniref:alpha/beta fold hydrolase n=1 Tax=Actinomadura sp. 9N407 TaxID=3375154 RepID=UPI0037AEA145
MMPSPRSLRAAASNVARKLVHGQVADLRPTPMEVIEEGPGRSVHRYRGPRELIAAGPPVLFVPPPAAPVRCYDLRRGCSLAEHLVNAGRRSYLLDQRPDGDEGAGAGLPEAIGAVSRDAGGQPVQLVGWSLGGILALLAAAADPPPPVASVVLVAAPADPASVPVPGSVPGSAPRWPAARPAGSLEAAVAGALFGGLAVPSSDTARGLLGVEKYLLRPYQMLTHLDDADFLAQIEALDHFANAMMASSGRRSEGLRSAFLRETGEAGGELEVDGRRIGLDGVRVPVLAIAGRDDRLAPASAVRPLTRLLPNAPEVRFEVAPGGHVGVLTGSAARTTTWAHLDRWLDEGIVRHGLRAHRRRPAAI